jgi:putative tricarboxylic transport membrane protein
MKKRVQADGLIWFVLGISICIGSVRLKLGSFSTPGPGFLPFLSGASLGIFGLILAFPTIFDRLRKGEESKNDKGLNKWDWKKFLNPLLAVISLLVYIVLLEPLGFLLTTFLFLLLLFKLSEPKRWLAPLIFSVTAAILSYLLFSVWLQCQFPRGLIKFW